MKFSESKKDDARYISAAKIYNLKKQSFRRREKLKPKNKKRCRSVRNNMKFNNMYRNNKFKSKKVYATNFSVLPSKVIKDKFKSKKCDRSGGFQVNDLNTTRYHELQAYVDQEIGKMANNSTENCIPKDELDILTEDNTNLNIETLETKNELTYAFGDAFGGILDDLIDGTILTSKINSDPDDTNLENDLKRVLGINSNNKSRSSECSKQKLIKSGQKRIHKNSSPSLKSLHKTSKEVKKKPADIEAVNNINYLREPGLQKDIQEMVKMQVTNKSVKHTEKYINKMDKNFTDSQNERYNDTESGDDNIVESFFDKETKESEDEEESCIEGDSDFDHEIAFQGGSLSKNKFGVKPQIKDSINLFELYSNSSSDYESDLSDFVVDDDVVDYDSASDSLEEAENKLLKFKKISKSVEMNKSGSDDDFLSPATKKLRTSTLIVTEDSPIKGPSDRTNKCCNGVENSNGKSIIGTKKENDSNIKTYRKKSKLKAVSFQNLEETDEVKESQPEIQEDIYGRLRDKDGKYIIQKKDCKYIPPAIRKMQELGCDSKKKEQLFLISRKLKGLFNRLSESNINGIINSVEECYQSNSHNYINNIVTKLLMEAIVSHANTSERLIQEYALLVAVISSTVGLEIGAHIITDFVIQWQEKMDASDLSSNGIENKELDNLLFFIVQLYNFNVVDALLVYDILNKMSSSFLDKEVDLILLVLRSVGFTLRKDSPSMLKTFVSSVREQADQYKKVKKTENYTRIEFMLEVLGAIRNNNVTKVPNYDPSHTLHLKSLMKGLIPKGKSVPNLNVSLTDLLKSRTEGRWWIIGSAYSGGLHSTDSFEAKKSKASLSKLTDSKFSEQFMVKASKLRLSRPPLISILYSMTEGAIDVDNAFENLLQLNLSPTQKSDIFRIMILCCIKGISYNPFYAHLGEKFCNYDRSYKPMLQCTLWDRFSELSEMKTNKVSNLAQFVAYLIGQNVLYISVLKTIVFINADSSTVSFLRQLFMSVLSHTEGTDKISSIFTPLTRPQYSFLRQSLRVFILKFIDFKNLKNHTKTPEILRLKVRVNLVLKILASSMQLSL